MLVKYGKALVAIRMVKLWRYACNNRIRVLPEKHTRKNKPATALRMKLKWQV